MDLRDGLFRYPALRMLVAADDECLASNTHLFS
jgi:hypothetical protein